MDIDSYVRKTPAAIDPGAGNLLLAGPMLLDKCFYRSVVLLLDREETGGHLGLVMNKPLEIHVDEILDDWPGTEKVPLYFGGPVELDRLFMLHRLGSIIDDSEEILPGIFVGGDTGQLRDYIASGAATEGLIRFYIGYSGWGSGQLTKELLENTWAVNQNPDASLLLTGAREDYWKREVQSLGSDFRSWLSVPAHPSLN